MKTLEQKAKAYDEALKVIKGNLDALNEFTGTGAEAVNIQAIKNCFYKAFPELKEKESEDERIRKAIIRSIEEDSSVYEQEVSKEQMLAYLEKQKEQKPNLSKSVGLEQKPAEWSEKHIADIFEKVGLAKIVREQGNDALTNAVPSAMIELSKTKSAEWSEEDNKIIYDAYLWLCEYAGSLTQKNQEKSSMLYKTANRLKSLCPQPKVEWNKEDEYKLNFLTKMLDGLDQREFDTKYMKELSSWLKSLKPQPKNEWSEEDSRILYNVIAYIGYAAGQRGVKDDKFKEANSWLKSLPERFNLPPKQEWSKEDENKLNHILEIVHIASGSEVSVDEKEELESFLRSLRPHPKKEWSKEDEEMFDEALTGVLLAKNRMNDTGCIGLAGRFEKAYKWLKSLRPQSSWKPSEEQLKALKMVANAVSLEGLNSLFEDLKKL